ncbi:MAG: MFS transporter [Gammaproteobacteria bacterium]|nr:MFS transporter [Gammaproteobacteria bacterium]
MFLGIMRGSTSRGKHHNMTGEVTAEVTHNNTTHRAAFAHYLVSSSLWMAGMSLYGFLFTWLLIGILDRPADEAGFARLIAEMPPLALLLLGGVLGDRMNGRSYLVIMHLAMVVPPLLIAVVYSSGMIGYLWVVLFGVLTASIQSLSDPARQAALSRVSHLDIQRSISVVTIVTTGVGMFGFWLGGYLEEFGLSEVLLIQALLFLAGVFFVRKLPDLPPPESKRPSLAEGLRATWANTLARNLIGLNFLSSLFNAGAYIIAIPYIVKEVYGGDASLLASIMIVFTCGSVGSNILLYWWMPLLRPGRLFLHMQLSRIVILGALFLGPPLWLFYVLLFCWGLNMGITTTMVRSTVQEVAPVNYRAQILSVLLLSFMVSSPVSSYVLGQVIEAFDPLAALLPGIVISVLIFWLGVRHSGLWTWESPALSLQSTASSSASR